MPPTKHDLSCCECQEDVTARFNAACSEEAEKPLLRQGLRRRQLTHEQPGNPQFAVTIQCSHGHWCTYDCPSMGTGTKASPVEVEELKSLQKPYDPGPALERIDTLGRWLFGSVVVVGALAAAFSGDALARLKGLGQNLFVVAVVVAGLSLGLAAVAIGPLPKRANPNSLVLLRTALRAEVRSRGRFLLWSVAFFGAALVLAGAAPLASLMYVPTSHLKPGVSVSYGVRQDSITVEVRGRRLLAGSPVLVALRFEPVRQPDIAPHSRAIADDSGTVRLLLSAGVPRGAVAAHAIIDWSAARDTMSTDSLVIPIREPGVGRAMQPRAN